MLTINKKVKISKANHQIVFDLEDKLPEGEYEVQLLINDKEQEASAQGNYNLADWSSGIKLDFIPTFRREEMYGDDGR